MNTDEFDSIYRLRAKGLISLNDEESLGFAIKINS
jgi:hypothetical protein